MIGGERPEDAAAADESAGPNSEPPEPEDELAADGPDHGWTLLFPDRHPYAGGPGHYAAYLASTDNFEVELVAAEP